MLLASGNDQYLIQGIFQDLEYVSQLMGVKLFFSFHRGTRDTAHF